MAAAVTLFAFVIAIAKRGVVDPTLPVNTMFEPPDKRVKVFAPSIVLENVMFPPAGTAPPFVLSIVMFVSKETGPFMPMAPPFVITFPFNEIKVEPL